jgi:hypothetical protein
MSRAAKTSSSFAATAGLWLRPRSSGADHGRHRRIYQPAFPYSACKFEVEAFLDTFGTEHSEIECRLRPNILLGEGCLMSLDRLRKSGIPLVAERRFRSCQLDCHRRSAPKG